MDGKFKKIELYGFKSFADKHEIPFNDGITVIVGPNGCGKSNVSDSVRWVLGEQSAKQIRGHKMQDVIFCGTAKRKLMSYCEVGITFDNKDKKLFPKLEYDDVVISRKLYRSGESEYAVNKIPTRLKDIVEMLRDANMGREGYSIIGQGRVASLISAKPEDRRAIFEEAAGVAKYKQRKKEVESKLARTRENLQRVNDILHEKHKQLEPLLKQAENAKKWLEFYERLKYLEINTYIYQYDNASTAKEIINTRLNGVIEEMTLTQQKYEQAVAEYNEAMASLSSLDKEIASLRDEQLALTVDIEKQNGDKKVLGERLIHVTQELTRLENENNNLTNEIASLQSLSESGKIALAEKEAMLKISKTKVEELRGEYNRINDEIIAKEKEAEDRKSAIVNAMDKLAEIKSNMSALTAEKKGLQALVIDLGERIASYEKDFSSNDSNLKNIALEAQALRESVKTGKATLLSKKNELSSITDKINMLAIQIDDVSGKFHAAQSRRKMLTEMQDAYDGYNNSIKYLMNDAKTDKELSDRIDGEVAQLISVDETFETAIETALGNAAQNIVTKDEDAAKYIISYLKKVKYGRITFLPLTSVKPRSVGAYSKLFAQSGVYGVASDIVKYDPKYKNVVEGLLGGTVIVDDMDTAVLLAKQSGYAFKIVTLDGDVITPQGSLTGGSRKNEIGNLFSHDRELNQTKALIEKLSATGKNFISKRDSLIEKKKVLEVEIEQLSESVHVSELSLAKMDESVSKLSEIVDDKQREVALLALEQEAKQRRIEEITKDIESVSELEEIVSNAKSTATEDEESYKQEYEELKRQRDEYSEKLTEERLSYGVIDSEVATAFADIRRIEYNLENSKRRVEFNLVKIKEGKNAIIDINERLNYVGKNDQGEALKRIEVIKTQLADFDEYKSDLNVKVAKLDEDRSKLTTEVQQLQEKKAQEEYKLIRVDADIEQMQERILEEYHLEYNDCLPFKQEDYNIEEGTEEASKIKRQMSHLGNVNVDAIEQSKEVSAEYNDLNTQREDLEKAANDAEEIIKTMSEEMLTIFNTEFEKIRVNFSKIFKDLFNGGEANLEILNDSEDPLNAGIEILATPPGKDIKAKSIQLLSGGEQSLTAIAILFSILKLKAMPFCILDEIDSALDDANTSRFAKYLKRFSGETQFIVITHRKPTMELADNLYGVTMEEPGVSKIVSVKLSDAVSMADKGEKKEASNL